MTARIICLEQAKAERMMANEQRRDAWQISEHESEFYFHGFDRPFSRAELLLIARLCEARAIK